MGIGESVSGAVTAVTITCKQCKQQWNKAWEYKNKSEIMHPVDIAVVLTLFPFWQVYDTNLGRRPYAVKMSKQPAGLS